MRDQSPTVRAPSGSFTEKGDRKVVTAYLNALNGLKGVMALDRVLPKTPLEMVPRSPDLVATLIPLVAA